MSKTTKNYEQLATAVGFRLDEQRNVLYGQRNGYEMIAYAADKRYPYLFTVTLSVKVPMGPIEKSEIKQFVKREKEVTSLTQNKGVFAMIIRSTSNQAKLAENFNNSVNALIEFLRSKGCVTCCQQCGQQVETASFEVGGSYMHLCPDCAGKMRQDRTLENQQKQEKSENIVGGFVGALLGSVIGIICIIFFSQLGRISVLSGFVMAICTIKGYEMLGGKLTKKGIVISFIMMLVMTYVGDRMDWAIFIARELEVDFFTGFQYMPILLEEEIIDVGTYWYNIILLYLFTIGGAIPTVIQVLKDRKTASRFGQVGSMGDM